MEANRFYGKRKQHEPSLEKGPGVSSLKDGRGANKRPRENTSSLHTNLPLLEPERVWRVFPRQQMAYDFARTCCQSTAVFAYESEEFGHSGQRKYLVTTYYEFGQRYLAMKLPKHFYEVISEGSACHLYFDIEFKMEYNKSVIPLVLLETFIEYVCYHLHEQFRLSCDRHNIIDLDSSTEAKFSRHLVFHIPKTVFRNNIHVGNFVHFVCDQLRELRGTGAPKKTLSKPVQSRHIHPPVCKLLALFVKNENGAEVLICDEGVYTKNRNFRLLHSSKLGKKVPLVVSKENKFLTSYSEDVSKPKRSRLYNILMDSLVCNVRFERSCKVLEFMPPNCRSKSSVCNAYRGSGGCGGAKAEGTEEGYYCSPYPSVDQFITSRVVRGGVQGTIRRWTFFPQGKLLAYDIQHNRWCENIGRAHKSNNIMMIADLSRGIYYQKCHDPDCKRTNFRSQEYEIPRESNPVQVSGSEPQSYDIARTEPGGGIEWVERLSEQDMRDFLEDSSFPNPLNSEDIARTEMDNALTLGSGDVLLSNPYPGLDGCSKGHEMCIDTTEAPEHGGQPAWRQMGQETIKEESSVTSATEEEVESIRLDHELDDVDDHLFIEALDNYESSHGH